MTTVTHPHGASVAMTVDVEGTGGRRPLSRAGVRSGRERGKGGEGRRRAILLLAFLTACRQGPDIAPGELVEVPHPDPSAVEAAARGQLEQARERLEAALTRGKDRREVGDAFGGLGELYHAYELSSAAAACYANAETLDPESFLWPYYLGVLRQAEGDLDGALAALQRAVELRAGDPTARLRLGEVLLARGDPAAAAAHFEHAAGAPDFAAAARFGLGRAAAARGDAAAAVEHLEAVLELQPEAGSVHHHLAMALRQLGRAEEAARELELKGGGEVTSADRLMARIESLAITSGAFLKRGNRALVNGLPEEAIGHYRRAIAADPTRVEARRNLAQALQQTGDVDGTLETLREAAEVAPGDPWVHLDLGSAYGQKGLAEQAIAAYRRAIEIAPDMVTAHFNLANALIGRGLWQEARAHLDKVLELDPGESRARYLDAMAHYQTGEADGAVERLRQLLRDEPGMLAARRDLAKIFEETRRPAQAAEVFREGLALDLPPADRAQLHAALADFHWRSRRPEDALTEWRRAVELVPEASAAHVALANPLQVHAHTLEQRGTTDADEVAGLYAEAREHFARAAELAPRNATAWISEARLWIRDRQFERARQRLEEALTHLPQDPTLTHDLARLYAICPDAAIRDGRRALELARRAFTLQDSVDHAETVAMAMAELGHFEEAIKWQRGVLQRALASNDRALIQRVQARLQLYESRTPVRM